MRLLSRVVEALENHLGVGDRTLAEFAVELGRAAARAGEGEAGLVRRLAAEGCELPRDLVGTLHALVARAEREAEEAARSAPGAAGGGSLTGAGGAVAGASKAPAQGLAAQFPGLAVPDDRSRVEQMEQDIARGGQARGEGSSGQASAPRDGRDSGRDRRVDEHGHRDDDRHRRDDDRHRRDDDRYRRGDDRHRRNDDRYRRGDDRYRREDERYRRRDDRYSRDDDRMRSQQGWRERSRSPDRAAPSGRAGPVEKPKLYACYRGRVSGLMQHGCFVQLAGLPGHQEGLVHVSNMAARRVANPSDVVQRGDEVWVKVISVAGQRLGLSLRDVDQQTGRDLAPTQAGVRAAGPSGSGLAGPRSNPSAPVRHVTSANAAPLGQGSGPGAPPGMAGGSLRGLSGVKVSQEALEREAKKRPGKRLSSPERWEVKQLIASGVLDVKDYPTFDEEDGQGILGGEEEVEEDFEIDLNDEEPAFLRGQTASSGAGASPVKIVKNPDGSMQRAAMTQSALAKERREMQQEQQRAAADAVPKDLSRPWEDPMAENGQRLLAQDFKGAGLAPQTLPEWKKAAYGKATSFGQRSSLSITEQRRSLPIFKLRDEVIQAVRDNQILVVIGETGSGKTTQMTQYFVEAGLTRHGRIGCTQPRRVAAMSVAKRVAEEMGCRLGEQVGYTIRFEDMTSRDTLIKYMTDGMLLREALIDEQLSSYSLIMLDEAHERTIHTDVLFGLLKKLLPNRPNLKLIVTSATLDAEKFSEYFMNAPIFTIPGRTFPVEVLYTKQPEPDYLDAALITVMQIHLTEPEGDVLLFLTGQEEIDQACQILFDRMKALGPSVPELIILPVYSSLPSEMQTRIFDPAPPGSRKVVVATNIAEASLTIDGIYYVVDPGFAKQKVFNPKVGMDSLVVAPISQASARQRSGRAGRTGPGKCYRLYTEAAFKAEMLPTSVPEIQRTNLGMTVLMLKAMGINDMIRFDFMDPPSTQTLVQAMQELYNLNALDEEGLLTRLGRKMAEFPLEPSMSKTLIAGVDLGCSEEVLTILSMLSAQNIFYRPKEKQNEADQRKARFHQAEGDHLTLLGVYEAWKRNAFSPPWCFENFLQSRSLKRAQDVRKQLLTIMDRYRLDMVSCGTDTNRVRRALCAGFFTHAAHKDPQEGYKTLVEQQPVYIHPSSAVFQRQPDWVIYHELVLTTKEYMREVTAIDPKWLTELAPRFYTKADPTKLSRRKQKEKIEPLFDRYAEDQNAWRLSKRKG